MKYTLLALFLLNFSLQSHSASFDCAKAKSFIEKEICSNQELGSLDEKLAESYKNAISSRSNASDITNEQRKWLREVRNICTDTNCLIKSYQSRIKEIQETPLSQVPPKTASNEPIFDLPPQELKNSIPKTSLAEFETKYLNDFKLFYKRFQYLVQNNKKEEISELEAKRSKCEVYSRVVGYIRPVAQWNDSKQAEFADRTTFEMPNKI